MSTTTEIGVALENEIRLWVSPQPSGTADDRTCGPGRKQCCRAVHPGNGKKADVTNRVRVPHNVVSGGHRVVGRADARAHQAVQQRRVPAVFRRGGSVMTLYICAVLPVLTAAITIRRWSRG